ncbi:MAG: hypothetical protein ACYDBL_11125 [Candidatus Acidiferrales bacterium]
MRKQRANYREWLRERSTRLASMGRRLSHALSSEWARFRHSSLPAAGHALLGLLRSSIAFLSAPLYKPAVLAGAEHGNGRAQVRDMYSPSGRPVERRAYDRGMRSSKVATVSSSVRPMSYPRPVLVADRRETMAESTARQDMGTAPGARAQTESEKTATAGFSMGPDAIAEQVRGSFQAVIASAIENIVHVEYQQAAEQMLDVKLCDLLDRRCKEICGYIEGRLNFFYDQTALRLDAISEQVVTKFCEALNQQAAATLNALVLASAQQTKTALNAESQTALERFDQQMSDLSEAHIDAHRKEMQNLSANLQVRLRRVAYTLEDMGVPAASAPQTQS